MIVSFSSLSSNVDFSQNHKVSPNKNVSHQICIQVWGVGKGGTLTDKDLHQHLLENPVKSISDEERALLQKVIANRKRKKCK